MAFMMIGNSQAANDVFPAIGAQVIIEPGQTPEEVDTWFRILEDQDMHFCRIRMFETHMHRPDGTWDFSLYDDAFRAAEKHHVKIYATLFPATNTVGGVKFPESETHLAEIQEYIRQMVTHFKSFPSLYGWVLINEPGVGGQAPDNAFTRKKFAEWKAQQTEPAYKSKGYARVTFDDQRFLLYYNTWFLDWIAKEIQAIDPKRPLHVNNHQIFVNVAEYDFPAWRKFLTTLGASAHPSWHFGYFTRQQYALAMSANCDIIRSGAGNIPFWVTELQGGNNTYSGFHPFCPTREEIDQWLWTSIGSGAQGIIFWCLNPRATGAEAGEWAMIDFQNQPTDRLIAAGDVQKAVADHASLFAAARPVPSGITVMYNHESLWMEKESQLPGAPTEGVEGRITGAVMKSALAYYQVLSESGLTCDFSEMGEYNWNESDYSGKVIILAHQISLPSRYWDGLTRFVERGGKLIVSGLTGFFDENMHNIMKTGFPLEDLFGGCLKEVKTTAERFNLELTDQSLTLPAHLWLSTIHQTSGEPIGLYGDQVIAVRKPTGKGEVVWVPSLIGMGSWLNDDHALASFVTDETKSVSVPFRFAEQQQNILMKTLQSGDDYITVLVNKSGKEKTVAFQVPDGFQPNVLFNDKSGKPVDCSHVLLEPEETMVLHWAR